MWMLVVFATALLLVLPAGWRVADALSGATASLRCPWQAELDGLLCRGEGRAGLGALLPPGWPRLLRLRVRRSSAGAARARLAARRARVNRCPLTLVGCALALAGTARAGGAFEQIVAVGANGQTKLAVLQQTGPRSESALAGIPVPVPTTGYIRIYPFIGQLPAIPGRFYPHEGVLCLYWHEP